NCESRLVTPPAACAEGGNIEWRPNQRRQNRPLLAGQDFRAFDVSLGAQLAITQRPFLLVALTAIQFLLLAGILRSQISQLLLLLRGERQLNGHVIRRPAVTAYGLQMNLLEPLEFIVDEMLANAGSELCGELRLDIGHFGLQFL